MKKIKNFVSFDYIEALARKYLSMYAKESGHADSLDVDYFVEITLGIQLVFENMSDVNEDYAVNIFNNVFKLPSCCSTVGKNGFDKSIIIDSVIAETDEALYRWLLANAAANSVLYNEPSYKDVFFEYAKDDVIHLNESYCFNLRCGDSFVNTPKYYANMLAAAFLMPLSSIMKFFEERGSLFADTGTLIYEIADCFCVPNNVVAYRLLNLFDRYGVVLQDRKKANFS